MTSTRSVVITGANGGIGQALCAVFRKNGWHVIASDRHASAQTACEQYVSADLSRLAADVPYRDECLGKLRAALPNRGALDALINNAALQIVAPVEKLTAADWATTCNVNVVAPFLLAQGMLKELEATGGAIVNIGSIHAQLTKAGFSAYAASKAALVGLTRSLAVELGGRVRVNAICPAAVATPMLSAGFAGYPDRMARLADCHPSGQIATPEEIAEFTATLASNGSKYITGAIINLDGGISSRLFDPA